MTALVEQLQALVKRWTEQAARAAANGGADDVHAGIGRAECADQLLDVLIAHKARAAPPAAPDELAAMRAMRDGAYDALGGARAERDAALREVDELRLLREREKLAGRAVALSEDVLRGLHLMRRHLEDGGHDWRGGTQMADVKAACEWLDRLLAGTPAVDPAQREGLAARLSEIASVLQLENDEQGTILRAITELQRISVQRLDADLRQMRESRVVEQLRSQIDALQAQREADLRAAYGAGCRFAVERVRITDSGAGPSLDTPTVGEEDDAAAEYARSKVTR